jgi:hypothetical protein
MCDYWKLNTLHFLTGQAREANKKASFLDWLWDTQARNQYGIRHRAQRSQSLLALCLAMVACIIMRAEETGKFGLLDTSASSNITQDLSHRFAKSYFA